MGNTELAGAAARAAETADVVALSAKSVNAGISVAVSNVKFPGRGHANVRRVVERCLHCCPVPGSQRTLQIAGGVVEQDLVGVAVSEINGIVGADVNVVGFQGNAIPAFPGVEEVPVAVKNQHRRPLALGHVHPIPGIYGHAAGARQRHTVRQLCPAPVGIRT